MAQKLYPNVEHLAAALPQGSLARTLCECFVGAGSQEEAEDKVRAAIDRRRAALQGSTSEGDTK